MEDYLVTLGHESTRRREAETIRRASDEDATQGPHLYPHCTFYVTRGPFVMAMLEP